MCGEDDNAKAVDDAKEDVDVEEDDDAKEDDDVKEDEEGVAVALMATSGSTVIVLYKPVGYVVEAKATGTEVALE